MAIAAVLPAMNGDKALHPFFAKVNGQQDAGAASSSDDVNSRDATDEAYDESGSEKPVNKRRKPKSAVAPNNKTQRTLQELVNPTTATTTQRKYDGLEIPNSCSSDPILTPPRKKRRTSPIEAVEVLEEQDVKAGGPPNGTSATPQRQPSPQVIIPASSPLPAVTSEPASEDATTAPKKMLRLNASGKFSSPPSKKPKEEQPVPDAPRRRGRPRKSKEVERETHVAVVIKYSPEADLGNRIDRIMGGEERFRREVKMTTPKKPRTPRKRDPSKPTHPFFVGKPKDPVPAPAPKQESPRKASAVTPGKLRRQALSFDRSAAMESNDTWTSTLLKDRLMMKHPGAMEPAWPNKEQAHVRGLESSLSPVTPSSQRRKRKAVAKVVSAQDSLLSQFASRLTLEDEGALRADGFREPHPCLVIPRKLLISGQEIWECASKELSTNCVENSVGEQLHINAQRDLHPSIQSLRDRAPEVLTAFDETRGETNSWTQKYAPSTAAEVLQPSKEMDILKKWLTSLTVSAVESSPRNEHRSSPKPEAKPKKKRRRKNKDLDDFLVDSDEEVHDMDELSDPEDVPLLSVSHRGTKSVVQFAGDGVRLSNAVLLAGPHGCGKTAAAYAVAKQLDFKIFEISPCEKRSGKDVLDRVGDMAENHLVKHHGTDSGETSAAEEPTRNDEAFQADLASGRQGKMDSFFKPKAKPSKASPKKPSKPKVKAIEQLQNAIKKRTKDQQQSLILLEEVDVLFKEDKEFWSTVLKLMSTSKRPFIMTCNDEDLVPLQAMALHAILRFAPPPIELATDYLLAIAASEGHLIKRDAMISLYKSKKSDLRAAISELNFWCQMGIGDPKEGLGWIYQRYPPGSDLDQQGRRLRVVSKGSFQDGMGHTPDSRLSEQDQALWAVEAFDCHPLLELGWNGIHDMPSNALPSLNCYEQFTASLSAADIYTALLDNATLDTSLPPMTDRARSQYIEGMALWQTDEIVRYDTLLQELAIATSFGARRVARLDTCNPASQSVFDSHSLSRRDFACFDAVSLPTDSVLSSHPGLPQSIFDGPLEPIAVDIAPYVRSILQYEAALSEQRDRLNSILGEGQSSKRLRNTRAARSALHGSQRSLTRREKWFTKDLDVAAVLATGGEGWPRATASLDDFESREGTDTPSPSAESV